MTTAITNREDLEAAAAALDPLPAEETLRWMVENYHPKLYVACSFQKEASVIMDMLLKIEPEARFFYLDTDVLFPETYETRDQLEAKYGIKVDRYHNLTLQEQAKLHGDELWKSDPDRCCQLRKVEPLKEALGQVDGWISGLRREQSATRAGTKKVHWDDRFGLVKANPLADWSEEDVWDYLLKNDVPYNPLHNLGYPSIGCTHCTKPADNTGDRSGRWSGSEKTECGLHG